MPLGRSARLTLASVILATGSLGCSTVPASIRNGKAPGDVRTRIGPDRPAAAEATTRAQGPAETATPTTRLALDRLDEISPLPPALERPPAPVELPSPRPEVAQTRPEPTPLLDEAVRRADEQTEAIADEMVRSAAAVPADSGAIAHGPNPIPEPVPSATEIPGPPASARIAVELPKPAPEPTSPDDSWREGVQRLRAIARDRLKGDDAQAKPGSPSWAVRDRLLGWLAEPDIDPDPRGGDQVARGRAILKGLAALIDPGVPAEARGEQVREAVTALESVAPLEITELKLCRKVDGFGNFDAFDPPSRRAGQPMIIYSEVSGLAYEPAGPAFRSRLAANVELFAEGSETPTWSKKPEVAEDTCRRRRRDYYVNYRIDLPEALAPGTYRLRLTQRDLIADQVAVRETALSIAK